MFLVLTGSSASLALRLGNGGDPSNGVRSLSAIADSEKKCFQHSNYNFPQLSKGISLSESVMSLIWDRALCVSRMPVRNRLHRVISQLGKQI